MNVVPVSEEARQLWRESLAGAKRILVLGAGGWFGKTALALSDLDLQDFMLVGSSARKMRVGDRLVEIIVWSEEEITQFRPDLILDFAFLTRNWITEIGEAEFVLRNRALINRLNWLTKLESVSSVVTVSSGASQGATGDLYGEMKLEVENLVRGVAEVRGLSAVIARVWSVSRGLVSNPGMYAFSSFANDALTKGAIKVDSDRPVQRRYCAVEEVLAVSAYMIRQGGINLLESGGDKIEFLDLAYLIADLVGGVRVTAPNRSELPIESASYISDNSLWLASLEASSLKPLTIEEQAKNVIQHLSSRS